MRVAIILIDAHWPVPAAHDFTMYDESRVLLELPSSDIMSRASEDVAIYRRLFDLLEAGATTDIEEILDGHAARYHKLAGARYT